MAKTQNKINQLLGNSVKTRGETTKTRGKTDQPLGNSTKTRGETAKTRGKTTKTHACSNFTLVSRKSLYIFIMRKSARLSCSTPRRRKERKESNS
jgi:hypothetical protein